jgi:hypothetical protein
MKYTAFAELYNCADLAFVARAADNGENPTYWYMKIEEDGDGLTALATDNRRLHKARVNKKDAPGLSPGYWQVLKNKTAQVRDYETEDELGFPDRRVYIRRHILWLTKLDSFDFFPPDEAVSRLYPDGEPLKEGVVDTHKYRADSINALIKNLPDHAGINPGYLRDLGPHKWNYKIFSGSKSVLFEHENKTALIMPLWLQ